MAGDTKRRILETALELFAQSGYLGTSMSDIAKRLGITKAALYKHYTCKQEILDRIVERMNEMDYERAKEYEMPETEPDGFAEAYLSVPIEKIRPGACPALSELPCRRAGGVYGGHLSEADGLRRGRHAACAGVLRADVPALQRL